jgi:hypothetical protein
VQREVEDPGTFVTVILPRRSYSPLLGRLLHDRTADKMAAAISRIPRSAATIVPYDVPTRVAVLQARQAVKSAKLEANGERAVTATSATTESAAEQAATAQELSLEADVAVEHSSPDGHGRAHLHGRGRTRGPVAAPSVAAIGSLTAPGKAAVEGKVRVVEIRPVERNSVLAVEINDSTGNLTAMFYGRSHIPGLICGARVRFTGSVGIRGGQPVMINPAYELVAPGEA